MSIETMKQALAFVEANHSGGPDAFELMDTLRQAIAEAEKQEPVGHADLEINNIYLFNDQEQRVVPTGRQPLYTHPPKREHERYFCERCGKRLSGGIHTCTPPAEACG